MAGHRRAARADRAVQPQGELLGVRPDRPLRPVLGALPRPRAGLRQGRRPARRRQRALHGVLEPRVHAVRPGAAQLAHPAPGQEHRHGARPGAARVAAAGRAERVRDRRVPAAGRAGGGAQRPQLRQRLRDRPGAADPRRPRARHQLPARGRRRALQRGPRLPAAADHAARDRAGPPARHRGPDPGAVRGARARRDGQRLPGARAAGGDDRDVARARGGAVHAHARAGHAAAQRAHRARQGPRPGGHRRRGGVPAARHLRLPVRADRGAGGRAGHGRRRGGLRARDGDRARPRALRGPARDRRRRPRGDRGVRAGGRASRPSSPATRRPSRRPRSARSPSRTARCS